MGILGGNQKQEPMHYGEVFGVWNHLLMAKGCMGKYQLLKNHTGDQELKRFLDDMMNNLIKSEIQTLDQMLRENGVSMPPGSKERPYVDPAKIPEGSKFTDMEVATCVSHDIAQALVSCSQIIGISTREDIAKFFTKHHGEIAMYGGRLLKLMKEKGWVVTPPLHQEIPEMAHA